MAANDAYFLKKQAQAERMIRAKGALAVLHSLVPGAYDPETGTTGAAYVDAEFYGVTLDYNAHLVDGETIKQGDLLCLLSAKSAVKPKPEDKLTIKGYTFRIVNVKDISPSEVSVMYELQLRKK